MSATPVRMRLSRRKGFSLQRESRRLNGLPAVNVARPGRWGNRHPIGTCGVCPAFFAHTREDAVEAFRQDIEESPELQAEIIRELAGKNLACWCRTLDEQNNYCACHADVLLEYAAKAGEEG